MITSRTTYCKENIDSVTFVERTRARLNIKNVQTQQKYAILKE